MPRGAAGALVAVVLLLAAGWDETGFASTPRPATQQANPLVELQRIDQYILTIGDRLVTAAGDLCHDSKPILGFGVHDLGQYPTDERKMARDTYGFGDAPRVLTLAPGSRAEAAGLRVDDALTVVDGAPVPPAPAGDRPSYARTAALLAQLDAAAADGALALEVVRDGTPRRIEFAPQLGCPTRFQVKVTAEINAKADGAYVEVNTGLIEFAADEDELAGIMAHEIAHNILHHRARLDAAGIDRGLLAEFGRSGKLIRRTEEEADRLSVYLMDRAGYDPRAIARFWVRYRKTHPLAFLRSPTHMSEKRRAGIAHEEIARIAAAKAAGRSPKPAFLDETQLPALE